MSKARDGAPKVYHSIMRAKERYGLSMDVEDMKRLCRMIQRNEGKLDRQNPDGTTQWFVTYKETLMRLVISQDFYKIVTFLPLDDATKYKEPHFKPRRFYRSGKAIYLGDKV